MFIINSNVYENLKARISELVVITILLIEINKLKEHKMLEKFILITTQTLSYDVQ